MLPFLKRVLLVYHTKRRIFVFVDNIFVTVALRVDTPSRPRFAAHPMRPTLAIIRSVRGDVVVKLTNAADVAVKIRSHAAPTITVVDPDVVDHSGILVDLDSSDLKVPDVRGVPCRVGGFDFQIGPAHRKLLPRFSSLLAFSLAAADISV